MASIINIFSLTLSLVISFASASELHESRYLRALTCTYVCPVFSVPKPNLACYSTIDDCNCIGGYFKSYGKCIPVQPQTKRPTKAPYLKYTTAPARVTTKKPTKAPTKKPTKAPTKKPTRAPITKKPTKAPTMKPTKAPTKKPTKAPTKKPTKAPTMKPTKAPTKKPTKAPTKKPTKAPTKKPTKAPTKKPTKAPTKKPTKAPTKKPTKAPTKKPTKAPTKKPTNAPVKYPTRRPTYSPVKKYPTSAPIKYPIPAPVKSCSYICPLNSYPKDKNICPKEFDDCKCMDGYEDSYGKDECVKEDNVYPTKGPIKACSYICPLNSYPKDKNRCPKNILMDCMVSIT